MIDYALDNVRYMVKDKIKVLVADDSGFMRLLIRDILSSDDQIEVVGTAENGKEALDKTISNNPDVVLLDMIMPEYDGLYAVEHIMKKCPTPIVVLSSIGHSNINPIMKSLELGAFDYLNKPVKGNSQLRTMESEIIKKIKHAASANLNGTTVLSKSANLNHHVFADVLPYDAIVIASSTGGPTALELIVKNLPGNLAVPVLIAQHMPENFVPSFALRLNQLVPLDVQVGRREMIVRSGKVIIAPGHKNMIVRRDSTSGEIVIDYSFKKHKEYNHPSANALMKSVSDVYYGKVIGLILTGMGKDGVEGMEYIKSKGGYTIAQNKETCAVFGMPREAIERKCIDSVVPITEMGGFVTSCLS